MSDFTAVHTLPTTMPPNGVRFDLNASGIGQNAGGCRMGYVVSAEEFRDFLHELRRDLQHALHVTFGAGKDRASAGLVQQGRGGELGHSVAPFGWRCNGSMGYDSGTRSVDALALDGGGICACGYLSGLVM